MNTNLFRTIIGLLAAAGTISMILSLLGCTSDPITEKVSCEASWIPIQYQPIVVLVLSIIGGLAKVFRQGTPSVGNLTKPTVIVDASGKPGTVTPGQVDATVAVKKSA